MPCAGGYGLLANRHIIKGKMRRFRRLPPLFRQCATSSGAEGMKVPQTGQL